MWNQVSLYIRYVDDRSINIKHYKYYGYSSNVLIQISFPQNKKEMFSDCFIGCFMSILIFYSVRLRHVLSWIGLLANENRSVARYHGLCGSASHPTVSTVEWGSLFDRSVPDRA